MKFLHTMIRVHNLDKSIDFYQNILGMKVLKKKDYPTGKFTLVFLGYCQDQAQLELTYNWDNRPYQLGDGYGHIAIGVEDIYKLCNEIESKGGKITRAPGPMKDSQAVLAFVEDPDGYKIELIQRSS